MGFSNRKGIAMAGGFKLQAEVPLDVRNRVDTIAERDELVTINAAWEGIHVYVANTKKTYEYKGNKTWEEVLTGSKYIHPTYTAKSNGLYKVTVDSTGHVSATTAVTKADITALGIPGSNTDTTYTLVTTTNPGLMSSADKVKLDGISKNANNFKGATSSANCTNGLVPMPYAGNQNQY